ncbi:MAG: hypothetical protein IKA36_01940 [Clostridia bacterium]|nr:hypothetical protein [Clostridia bacterium]
MFVRVYPSLIKITYMYNGKKNKLLLNKNDESDMMFFKEVLSAKPKNQDSICALYNELAIKKIEPQPYHAQIKQNMIDSKQKSINDIESRLKELEVDKNNINNQIKELVNNFDDDILDITKFELKRYTPEIKAQIEQLLQFKSSLIDNIYRLQDQLLELKNKPITYLDSRTKKLLSKDNKSDKTTQINNELKQIIDRLETLEKDDAIITEQETLKEQIEQISNLIKSIEIPNAEQIKGMFVEFYNDVDKGLDIDQIKAEITRIINELTPQIKNEITVELESNKFKPLIEEIKKCISRNDRSGINKYLSEELKLYFKKISTSSTFLDPIIKYLLSVIPKYQRINNPQEYLTIVKKQFDATIDDNQINMTTYKGRKIVYKSISGGNLPSSLINYNGKIANYQSGAKLLDSYMYNSAVIIDGKYINDYKRATDKDLQYQWEIKVYEQNYEELYNSLKTYISLTPLPNSFKTSFAGIDCYISYTNKQRYKISMTIATDYPDYEIKRDNWSSYYDKKIPRIKQETIYPGEYTNVSFVGTNFALNIFN